jgi:hypothetical protein
MCGEHLGARQRQCRARAAVFLGSLSSAGFARNELSQADDFASQPSLHVNLIFEGYN